MLESAEFPFSLDGINQIADHKYGKNWPITYILQKEGDIYIGKTTDGTRRFKEHYKIKDEFIGGKIKFFSDKDFNLSSSTLYESLLIEYLSADEKYQITNNRAEPRHNFYNKHSFERKFEILWSKFLEENFVDKDMLTIKNLDIFKYSPYKSLTDEQDEITSDIIRTIKSNTAEQNIFLINGGPGTGKSVMASYLAKELSNDNLGSVGLVIAMTSLRNTFKKVFRKIKGLKSSQVIGPNQVVNNNYDILIVDEAHRLKQRVNLTPGEYSAYDKTNIRLGLKKESTQFDWIINQSKNVILFFDEHQTVRPSDVPISKIKNNATKHYKLSSQMRIEDANEYVEFVNDLFFNNLKESYNIDEYDLKYFENFDDFIENHKNLESTFGLSRLVAGYAWEWISKVDETKFDICIGSHNLKWNSVNNDWVNSENAENEVGCIHTVQGYDLNYVNLIIGRDISYDNNSKSIQISKENYKDRAGKRTISEDSVLKQYIQNIYITLMTRGIKGANIYIVDENFRIYFKNALNAINKDKI